MPLADDNALGTFLRDRRGRLDPEALGYSPLRRRTPGLRREEVAQRANVSATWYTWLEQGRGGAPSADVLDRLAGALRLSDAEREHLFLLAQHRPPEVRYQPPSDVTPRLQAALDALEYSPALVKTSTWTIVAWNAAAAAVLTDYGKLPPSERNVLRLLFNPRKVAQNHPGWEHDARMAVATFRLETARTGANAEARALIDELCATSPAFRAMWAANDVHLYGEGTKRLAFLPTPISLDYTTYAVADRPDLGLVIYTAATPEDLTVVRALVHARRAARPPAAA